MSGKVSETVLRNPVFRFGNGKELVQIDPETFMVRGDQSPYRKVR
jgi:hypothetical protein